MHVRTTTRASAHPRFARLLFFGTVTVLAIAGILLMSDFVWRIGFSRSRLVFLILFGMLFSLLSLGFCHAFFGFLYRLFFRTSRITRLSGDLSGVGALPLTALVFPVYNEDVIRVISGVRAVYQDLQEEDPNHPVELFILSDSTRADNWIREETAWVRLCKELDAFGKIFYRRREQNTNKKSGNIADFCRKWGGRYTHMIVMDADSLMSGEAILRLIRMMEANPRAGIIQTAPRIFRSESVFARVQQFSSRLYGPIFQAGLDFWQGGCGNYWGHNAIIRMEPFIQCCDLPDLPGKEPFGGKILSHDFVEAALMVKSGWEAWLAWDIDATYEEGPPTLIDHAKRDRRWLQGNLQHNWLLFSKGLSLPNRVHLFMGIMGYAVSPLWLLFMLVGSWILWNHQMGGLSTLEVQGLVGRTLNLGVESHGLLIFACSMLLILGVKILTLIDLILEPERLRRFGGLAAATAGVLLETVISTLVAPVFMLFHTQFILWLFLGRSVVWATQQRETEGTSFREATRTHLWQVVVGLAWGLLMWWIGGIGTETREPAFLLWMLPVILGMVFSVPLSVFTSVPHLGKRLVHMGLWQTPEENDPPRVLVKLEESLEVVKEPLPGQVHLPKHQGITAVLIDPYVNAIHISLLPVSETSTSLPSMSSSMESLMLQGPDALSPEETFAILKDPDVLLTLHRSLWGRGLDPACPWWNEAILAYQ